MKVLCADDDEMWQRVLQRHLQHWGHQAIGVKDGAQALAALMQDDGPRIALIDWNMPKLSGPEVCRLVRGKNGRYTYIILVTGRSNTQSIIDGLNAGADDYLSKPVNPEELKHRLLTARRIIDLENSLVDSRELLQREMQERARAEAELRQAQKLEAVGQLAAGVAHEINTPIQFVGDSVHFMRDAFQAYRTVVSEYRRIFSLVPEGSDTPIRDELQRVKDLEEECDLDFIEQEAEPAMTRTLDGVSRVAKIVRALKSFAHIDEYEMRESDINGLINDTLIVAQSEYKYVADVTTDLSQIPPVPCHGGDLGQVFLNLIINAAHAIQDRIAKTDNKSRGHIRVVSRMADVAGWVEVQVRDDGTGIPPHIIDRIFEPFFTTKEVGRGTGQGLPISRAVITEKHKGSLTVESEVGVGTTFRIRLPLVQLVQPCTQAA